MKTLFRLISLLPFIVSCGSSNNVSKKESADYIIAFGSCNKQDEEQPLWQPILENDPDLFLWGGDNIYSDTNEAEKMKADYQRQKANKGYQKLLKKVSVLGIWDDHDYGLNDGGKNWDFKEESQQLFLDFMNVPQDSPRRTREGVYQSELIKTGQGSIKIILLDTRYFRDELQKSENPGQRYEFSKGTILGKEQWNWLENELKKSDADFNVILSSIQVISAEHPFEKWNNFPMELERLKGLITSSGAKNIILLSGDRHISEFSTINLEGLKYPLVDFTSSGLTHSYEAFSGEPNSYRKGKVVKVKSFGLLKFDFDKKEILLEMRGEDNELLQDYLLEFQ